MNGLLTRLGLPWRERTFIVAALLVILLTRLAVIVVTPRTADFDDLKMYQSTGQTVLAGVNPYDFSAQPEQRDALRRRMLVLRPGSAPAPLPQERWNYYVSGNLPASTVLYGALEEVAQGSRFVWRLLFILGDFAIFFGALALVKAARGGALDAMDQAGVLMLAVFNPLLVLNGTVLPEDKQFQTALMLFAAALLISPRPVTPGRGIGAGIVMALSVLFKMFGVFLFPLWLQRAWRDRKHFAVWTILGGVLTILPFLLYFGLGFIETMGSRASKEGGGAVEHASPWVLLPGLAGSDVLIAKTVLVILGFLGLCLLLRWRKIDLLNFCAGLCLLYGCFWLSEGSMDRENITIMFAMACLVTIAPRQMAWMSLAVAIMSAVILALGVGLLRLPVETVSAAVAVLFALVYGGVLWRLPAKPA